MTVPCVLSSVVAQDQLNAFVYEEVRQNLLHERQDFYVQKPEGSTGDFVISLGYVRDALVHAGWSDPMIMHLGGPHEYVYFSMNPNRRWQKADDVHCIVNLQTGGASAEAFALDVRKDAIEGFERGDTSELDSLIAQKCPFNNWESINYNMSCVLPNGDHVFYVSCK